MKLDSEGYATGWGDGDFEVPGFSNTRKCPVPTGGALPNGNFQSGCFRFRWAGESSVGQILIETRSPWPIVANRANYSSAFLGISQFVLGQLTYLL
jgi:hypothetical protein